MVSYNTLTKQSGSRVAIEINTEGLPDEVTDFTELRKILSKSPTCDVYCRSSLYFAVTGRSRVWTVKQGNNYLIMLPHPNIKRTLLVFFPFICDSIDLVNQLTVLYNCRAFLKQ